MTYKKLLLPVLIILLLSSNDTHAQFTLNSDSVFKNGSPNSGGYGGMLLEVLLINPTVPALVRA